MAVGRCLLDVKREVPRFPLMPDREDEHDVLGCFIAIEREVPAPPAGDDELPEFALRGPPNEGMSSKDRYGLCNKVDRPGRSCRIRVEQRISQAL